MTATIKTSVLQNASSAAANITLDTNGNEIIGGTTVMTSPFTMRNKIINGAMVIDQRNSGASYSTSSVSNFALYTLDRWAYYVTQASKFTIQQNAGSVTPPVGFTNYLGCTVGSSAYSVTSSDLFTVAQKIEGFNIADLAWGTSNAKTITVSFWVYSSLTGTFGGGVNNQNGNQSYTFNYTIPIANTWTQVSITIPGDTTGTWATNNGVGLYLALTLGAGSNWYTTAGSWASGSYWSTPTATNVLGTANATFYFTGVQLEIGTVATPFEYRNYQQELAMCQRYYYRILNNTSTGYVMIGVGVGRGSTYGDVPLFLPVSMRTTPSLGYNSLSSFQCTGGTVTSLSLESGNTNLNAPNAITLYVGPGFSSTSGQAIQYIQTIGATAGIYMDFSAEL
jgi:hypothetical protein